MMITGKRSLLLLCFSCVLLSRIGHAEEICKLQPLDSNLLTAVEKLTKESALSEKVSDRIINCLKEPCDTVKQGLVILSFKLKNTAKPAGDLQSSWLTELEPSSVAKVWHLLPKEARLWCIKAFIENLQCTVTTNSNECDEVETNILLEKFTTARTAYTDLLLIESGLEPFPEVDSKDENQTLSARESMARYAQRLKIDGPPALWLAEQFSDPQNETKLIEPHWFSSLAPQCRIEAFANVTDLQDNDSQADAADLDAAARIARFAWFYKTCHRYRIIAAHQDKDNIEAQEKIFREQQEEKLKLQQEAQARAAASFSSTEDEESGDGPVEEL
mmetsp:Transcript_1184/g.1453  ORF Transcript_1184/g.1453 Transcript_1184/m.1453 type:complete len:331 (-) Transcript_1184:178-1170(-)